jgi:putative methanogenesis marker protein 1
MIHRNTRTYWAFGAQEKYTDGPVVRTVRPDVTIRRAQRVLDRIGVTKVSDVTGLDRIGIPNFMTVRPRDLGPGISYYNGKGTTRADAHAGALMEAIERHAGERCDYKITTTSYRELRRYKRCVDPNDIIVPSLRHTSDRVTLEWVSGYDLIGNESIMVPLNFVVSPYNPATKLAPFMTSSNGLASGNTLAEAVCHAICEIVERDSQALALTLSQLLPSIHGILGTVDVNTQPAPRISLARLPSRAEDLIKKIQDAGLRIFLRDYTNLVGVAAISCTLVDLESTDVANAYGGMGAHPDARVALLRSLTEAAQSRISGIQGGREDLEHILKNYVHCRAVDIDELFGGTQEIYFDEIPTVYHRSIELDIKFLLNRMASVGLDRVIVFDLTRPEVGIPVVRVVVPRAETWPVFHLHTGRAVFGSRVAELLARR